MKEYNEFIRESEEYNQLVKEYETKNVEYMGEKFLQKNDPYYSLTNRMKIMEYPYLKMGAI